MPRYKSISEFRHTVIIQGKKYLIGPDDVIDSPSSLSYIFLQEVDSKTPITVNTPFAGGHQRIQNLKTQVDSKVQEANTSVDSLHRAFETFVAKYEKDMDDLTKQINDRFEENEKSDLANKQADTKFKEDTNRRLGILKDAVRTMEDEVFGPQEEQPAKN